MSTQAPSRSTKVDVAPGSFARAVIQESKSRPVVVDFWAPWCGPCRTIGPQLERLAAQGGGQWLLAKVNVDEDQAVAREYGIQSIPAVKAFRGGALVDEFVGAVPEAQIKAFLKKLVPSQADAACERAEALLAAGDAVAARVEAEVALEHDGRHARALLLLAGQDLAAGRIAEAVARLGLLLPADLDRHAAKVAQLQLLASKPSTGELAALREKAAAQPDDGPAQLAYSRGLLAHGDPRQALERLLALVKKHRREGPGEEARRAMVEAFELVGSRSELAEEFRTKLSREIFR
jgi:putative thioredoxin